MTFEKFIKDWKPKNIKEYLGCQVRILKQVKKDFIFKNKQSYIDFIRFYFGTVFEQYFYIYNFIYFKRLDYQDICKAVKHFLNNQ